MGDKLAVLPSGKESTVTASSPSTGIWSTPPGPSRSPSRMKSTSAGAPVGDAANKSQVIQNVLAHIVWMGEESLQPGRVYDVKLATKKSCGQVEAHPPPHRDQQASTSCRPRAFKLNEIGLCEFSLTDRWHFTRRSATPAVCIPIDRLTNVTVGAGMIVGGLPRQATGHYSEF